jgi:tRNA 2-thiouridine synthesizing protein A
VSSLMQDFDVEIDLSGLQCPLPVLKARKQLSSMKPLEKLKIISTDPAAKIDFPHYCAESGNELVWQHEEPGSFIFVIQKTHGN